jgi:hypothetical protein
MTNAKVPDWAHRARRLEGVPIDHYWRPEEGPVEGIVIAHTQEPNRFRPGEVSDLVIVEEPGSRFHTGIRIRSGLDALHTLTPGTRLFVSPHSPRPAPGGKGSIWSFDIYVEDETATADPGTNGSSPPTMGEPDYR